MVVDYKVSEINFLLWIFEEDFGNRIQATF